MANSVREFYGNQIRIRVSGLLFKDEKLLLAKHMIDDDELWAPPGGGLEFGESIEATLIREFKEEAGLVVVPGEFRFLTEYLKPPLHAVELFYKIETYSGRPSLGYDPEFKNQIVLTELLFIGPAELAEIPQKNRHQCLKSCTNPIELLDKQGQLK